MTVIDFPDILDRLRKERYWDAKQKLRQARRAISLLDDPALESIMGHISEAERLFITYVLRNPQPLGAFKPCSPTLLEATCMAMYKKETVTVVGDLRQGDPGFDNNLPKVKIRKADGSEEAVPKTEVQA